MPHGLIHVCMLTNWKPASPVSNAASIQMVSAPVSTLVSRAISLTHSGRRLESSGDQRARRRPARATSVVRIGNGDHTVAPHDDEPGEQQHDADADGRRVVAHVAALHLADAPGRAAHQHGRRR